LESVDPVERREYERVSIAMDIEVYHLHGENSNSDLSVISCRGRDVSGGRVSFYGQIRYQNEGLFRLRIPLCSRKSSGQAAAAKLLKVMGKVVWCKKKEATNRYVTGVQFLNIYEQELYLLNGYIQDLRPLDSPFPFL
jgi:c-di-GMP-binding flagellar brake protein YcgR